MRDEEQYRIDFLMRVGGLTEEQARQHVAAEKDWRDPGPPSPAQIVISFQPFHERSPAFAAVAGHQLATWTAIWTAATEGGLATMRDVLGRFESHAESPQEAIDWAVERCDNVWITATAPGVSVPLAEYLAGGD
ncbi:hypothetical protein ABH935_009463 [Catenulispora sp. GAS73]|uniref:hypothetical protein n=1 Tax=Catenulispora sp. GAS73 TaxID=3156269 RepID=UPI003512C3EC